MSFSLLASERRFYALDLNEISRKPSYTPDDYYGPLICIFGDCMPRESFSYLTFFAGRYFATNDKVRFGAAAGPSFVMHRKVRYHPIESDPGTWLDFGPGYDISHSNRIGAGVALKTMIEIRLFKRFWLEPAFYTNINTQHSTYSGNLAISYQFPIERR